MSRYVSRRCLCCGSRNTVVHGQAGDAVVWLCLNYTCAAPFFDSVRSYTTSPARTPAL